MLFLEIVAMDCSVSIYIAPAATFSYLVFICKWKILNGTTHFLHENNELRCGLFRLVKQFSNHTFHEWSLASDWLSPFVSIVCVSFPILWYRIAMLGLGSSTAQILYISLQLSISLFIIFLLFFHFSFLPPFFPFLFIYFSFLPQLHVCSNAVCKLSLIIHFCLFLLYIKYFYMQVVILIYYLYISE